MTTQALSPTTRHILVVDDDDMIRILLRESFWIYSRSPVEIQAVGSLEEARVKMHNEPTPSVVFVGLSLFTNGVGSPRATKPTLEFIRDIKSEHPTIKVVVYSKCGESECKEQAKTAGTDHYIVKGECTPSEIADFVESI